MIRSRRMAEKGGHPKWRERERNILRCEEGRQVAFGIYPLGRWHSEDGLVVNGGQGTNVEEEVLEDGGVNVVKGALGGEGLLRENHSLGPHGIGGKQAPVNESAVPEIRVVNRLCSPLENLLDELLGAVWAVEEELHHGGQQGKLHIGGLVKERVQEGGEELVGIVNAVGVVTDDPNHGGLCVRLVQGVEILAEGSDDGLVPVGVLPEDVLEREKRRKKDQKVKTKQSRSSKHDSQKIYLDHHDGLLDDIVHLGLDELQKDLNAAVRGPLNLDCADADGTHGLADKVNIDFGRVSKASRLFFNLVMARWSIANDRALTPSTRPRSAQCCCRWRSS